MTIIFLSLVMCLVFVVLSAFHFYWFKGGRWGTDYVFPTKDKESKAPPIPMFATLIVGLGLALMGVLYLAKGGMVGIPMPYWIEKYIYWFIPAIFILRGIGEFKYVGIFKKIKDTKFAQADTKIFVPLCFFIGVLGLIIQII